MKASRNLFAITQHFLLIISAAFFATAAIAQETLLEEIIVVGTKVQDGVNVQEAPYSITTLTDGYLEEAGIKDVFDMQQNVPGLIVAVKARLPRHPTFLSAASARVPITSVSNRQWACMSTAFIVLDKVR